MQRESKTIREEVQAMEDKARSGFIELEKRINEANKMVAQQK